MKLRNFLVLNRVRVSKPQRLTQILIQYPPPSPPPEKFRKLSPLSETMSIAVHFPTLMMACTGSDRQNRDMKNDANLYVLR